MLGMGDIDILAYDYCEASISRLSQLLNYCICIENLYECIKLPLNVPNTPKFIIVSANYHDITRLLPLTIIFSG